MLNKLRLTQEDHTSIFCSHGEENSAVFFSMFKQPLVCARVF